MKALKCKPSAQFAYNYSINVLRKCSNIISHRSHRSLTVNTSIIDLQRSTHRSPKVDTSVSEGRHIDLRKSTHRSSKVDTSIFEDQRWKHHTDNPTSRRQFVTEYSPQWRSIVLYLKIPYGISDEVTHAHTRIYGNSNTACDPTRALFMYYTPIHIAYMH